MNKKRIFLSLLLCAVLLWTAPVAMAEDGEIYTDNYLQYTITNGSITIVNYYGTESEVTVPASIGAYPVNTIAAGAFSGCEAVTKINLPDCIMTVEPEAFSGKQTIVFDSNTPEPIEREPDLEQIAQEEAAAQNPEQNGNQSQSQGQGQNQNSNQNQNQNQNEQTKPTDEQTPSVEVFEIGDEEPDENGVIIAKPVTTPDGTEGQQNGTTDNSAEESHKGIPVGGWVAIVVGVLLIAGGALWLWNKKHGKR